jgi:hypothetical protein
MNRESTKKAGNNARYGLNASPYASGDYRIPSGLITQSSTFVCILGIRS